MPSPFAALVAASAIFVLGAGACRSAGPPVPVAVPSPPAREAFHARCDFDRARELPEWDAWARETIQGGPFNDPDLDATLYLPAERRVATERMLRQGLAACDPRAAMAVRVARSITLLPDLRDLLNDGNVQADPRSKEAAMFRIMVVHTLTRLDTGAGYVAHLVPLLAHGNVDVRRQAAYYARYQPLPAVRQPLLDVVRDDLSPMVRQEAVGTLFHLAGVQRTSVAIFANLDAALIADDGRSREHAVRLVEKILDRREAVSLPE